jgi:hypothetical protein
MDRVEDPRDPERITYSCRHLLWQGILMFACGMRSRLQLLNDGLRCGFTDNLLALADVPGRAAAHPDTVNHLMARLPPEALLGVNAELARRLIRMRCFEEHRMNGEWLVAVDATELRQYPRRHCPHCLSRELADGQLQFFHVVLEARLIIATGITVSLASVPVQNPEGEYDKQDCEIKAFPRLAETLKRRFPQLRICLPGDSLYACQGAFEICRQNGWSFIAVFKEGRTPDLWRRAVAKRDRQVANRKRTVRADGAVQSFSWATKLEYQGTNVHAMFCDEEAPDGTPGRFAWVTDWRPNHDNIEQLTNQGGRQRWKIENEAFNSLKNGETGLKHDYGSVGNAWYNYYLLAQVALLILQLTWCGDLMHKVTGQAQESVRTLFRTIRNFAYRLRESLHRDRLRDVIGSIDPAGIQIRFDTS